MDSLLGQTFRGDLDFWEFLGDVEPRQILQGITVHVERCIIAQVCLDEVQY